MNKQPNPKIRLAPDPILTTLCEPVVGYNNREALIVCDMMYILLNSKTGIGLAANQAGYAKRIIIIKRGEEWLVMINPEIVKRSVTIVSGDEMCLSYPGVTRKIDRFMWVEVKYTDVVGVVKTEDFDVFPSCIIQHEIDHLNGKCLVGA